MDKVPNERIGELCGVTKWVDKRIDEGILRWYGHVERMENNRIANKVYTGECFGSRLVGRPRKKWIDTLKDCLKKRSLDDRQARRMVHDRNEWRRVEKGNTWGITRGMNP